MLPREVFEAEQRYLARSRRRRAYWSVSMFEGPALDALAPVHGIEHPALQALDVTDVKAGFVADPFMLRTDGRHFLFFEVYNRTRDGGEIGMASSADGLRWQYEAIVLRERHHLSYPFVFSHAGAHFLMPEAHETGAVSLYAAEAFPFSWRRVATLVTGAPYVDPTMISHQGHHYLFVGEAFRGVLHLFVADDICGPWRRHPASPLVPADFRHARPAGRFIHDGTGWIRLAQSTEPVYGGYVSGYRITRLDPHEYSETPLPGYPLVAAGSGRWNCDGMHHLDAVRREDGSWLAVADGLELRARWPGRLARAFNRLRRW